MLLHGVQMIVLPVTPPPPVTAPRDIGHKLYLKIMVSDVVSVEKMRKAAFFTVRRLVASGVLVFMRVVVPAHKQRRGSERRRPIRTVAAWRQAAQRLGSMGQ